MAPTPVPTSRKRPPSDAANLGRFAASATILRVFWREAWTQGLKHGGVLKNPPWRTASVVEQIGCLPDLEGYIRQGLGNLLRGQPVECAGQHRFDGGKQPRLNGGISLLFRLMQP